MVEAVIYLLAITAAQVVSAFYVPVWGILCQTVVLTVIIVRSILADRHLNQRVLLPLVLVPLLRIISLAMPLNDIPPIMLYYLSCVLVYVAAVWVVRILGYTSAQVGINLRQAPTQLIVAFTGITFGIAEYFILIPEPMIVELTLQEIWLPALILLVSTGFMVEFVFRGVLQNGITEVFGGWGIVYVSLLFTVTYIGFLPLIDLILIFVVALLFGYVVRKTGSIVGVALSRGIWNIALYLIVPFLLG